MGYSKITKGYSEITKGYSEITMGMITPATLCNYWFRFGPLEWIWRMLTYGNYFKICTK